MLPAIILFAATYVLISAFIDNIPYVATMIPAYIVLWLLFGV